ncbi:MAG: DUF4965 domain-containing protein [Bacteroidaceae bacterium]|nr:DUF4965 domain-containing protein [Bacteroidaceae bacterium]
MKKIVLSIALVAIFMTGCNQTAKLTFSSDVEPSFFEPYKQTDLRLPSVPLIVSDPYFSVWSPYDNLTNGSTRHWTNDEKPMEGLLRVDGTTYRWMGAAQRTLMESVVPMSNEAEWEAQYTDKKPSDNWMKPDFDASAWKNGKGAFGSDNYDNIRTPWTKEDNDIWVRRTVELTSGQLDGDLYLIFSHDDACEIYINGEKAATGIMDYVDGVVVRLDGEKANLLKEGQNVFAVHCYNKTGGALVDFGIFRNIAKGNDQIVTAQQKSVDVLACNTYYTFACGPVELDVVFTAPHIIDDLDLLSAPINYISYQVRSTDGQEHEVQFYFSTTPQMAVNKVQQPTISNMIQENGTQYLKAGTIQQPILAKTGDGICIDWGYLYLSGTNGQLSMASDGDIKTQFLMDGNLPQGEQEVVCQKQASLPTLAYVHDFGKTELGSSFAMIGYDEIWDIEYFYKRYKGYWAHEGKVSIFDMFDRMKSGYTDIMERCRKMDKTIYDDALAAGGVKYAEILSGSYRHVNAAHKLFRDDEGNVLFFSKENNSNGCVNTVDLTYPEAPLYLCYNPELQKGMMTSIFDYSLTGRWTKPFAAHDLGQYPKANGQVYGGDMPLEEAGNMITLAAQICKQEGNSDYVEKYWDLITTWADYLVENGLHPANQLCTDDFAGHWAGNCNLAIKAIMGVTGYAELAKMKGLDDVYEKYNSKAKEMAAVWESETKVNDHYELAYGAGEETWSQKYNMVWDKLWGTGIIPNNAMQTEVKYYLTKQNEYGLPLDCRKDYTKSDWIMWSAAMADNAEDFQAFVDPLYKYINETESRVPISDWHDTKTGRMTGFKARSVIGGYWMKVLMDKKATK